MKIERVRNRDVYSLGQILTAYKELACQNIEMKTGFDSMEGKFKAVDKRLDRLEKKKCELFVETPNGDYSVRGTAG